MKTDRSTERRECLLRRVAVIGGGAAGMMAAAAAAEYGAAVTLYEKNDRVGKKILATGNGKCNFSNRDFSVGYYYGNGLKGAEAHKLEQLFRCFSVEDTVKFFGEAGMLVKDRNGYLYPWSEQASTVLDILRAELDRRKVDVRVSEGIERVRIGEGKDVGTFLLEPFGCGGGYHAVVIACGGCAAAKTGSDGDGYRLAKQLGHRIVPTVPALVQLRCSDDFFRMTAGVRCEAGLTLYTYTGAADGKTGGSAGREQGAGSGRLGKRTGRGMAVQEEVGELQFTDYGISGIPVFQLSRQAAYLVREKKPVEVWIDFFPHMERREFEEMCGKRLCRRQGKTMEGFLLGMANKKINLLLLKLAGFKAAEPAETAGRERLKKLLYSYRKLQVHVSAANSFEHAQVTAGGVDMAEVSESLSSLKTPGVHFAGEILDVDGRCGGYNLQWAWTSGYVAGKSAALGDRK